MKKQILYVSIFLFIFSQLLFSQTDSNQTKKSKFNFKLGLNSNFIYDNSDFHSGFSGIGIFFEPFITNNFSVVLSINSLSIKTNTSGYIKTGKENISTRDLFFLLRYQFAEEKIVFYPQIGIGDWGKRIKYLTAGLGSDIILDKNYFLSTSVDYLIAGDKYSNFFTGKEWTSSLLKININFSYLFSL